MPNLCAKYTKGAFWRAVLTFLLPEPAWRWLVDRIWNLPTYPEGEEAYPGKRPVGSGFATGTRVIVALLPVVLGAWVSVGGRGPDGIAAETAAFWNGLMPGAALPEEIRWGTVVFWVLCLGWTRALYLRLAQDDRQEERYRADLMRSLFRLPNLDVLWKYDSYYRQISKLVIDRPLPNSREELGKDLLFSLTVIAEMAQTFARNRDADYGASIMLAVGCDRIGDLPVTWRTPHTSDNTGRLRFAGYLPDVAAHDGLLILPADLALQSLRAFTADNGNPEADSETDGVAGAGVDADSGRTYPLISLPILRKPKNQILPGAPTAVLSNDLSAHRDTRTIADKYCTAFSEPRREEVRAYFAASGAGAHVRSLASIRIDNGAEPVGVLNIDTDTVNVLGADREFYPAFTSLLRPLLRLLEPLVKAYAEAWWGEIDGERAAFSTQAGGAAQPLRVASEATSPTIEDA